MTKEKFSQSLILFSLIMVPAYTLTFGLKKSPFQYTFSMIGNWFGHRAGFIAWGVITAGLLLTAIYNIYRKLEFRSKKAYRLLYLPLFFLILAVVTPTVDSEPLQQELENKLFYFNLHGLFAVLFGAFLLTSLFIFSRYLAFIEKRLSIYSLRWLLITAGGSIITLFLFGMSGIFEMFFFFSLSIFLIAITTGSLATKNDEKKKKAIG